MSKSSIKSTSRSATNINNYSLQNLENYNRELHYTPLEVFCKYTEIINKFILQLSNVLSYTQNEIYLKHILKCGITTITHIFNMMCLYTMNMDVTEYYCGQGAYYYSEFTEQMVGEHTSFLKLTTKDSIMFVYKKTIFDINDEYKNKFSLSTVDNNKFSIINALIKTYTDLIFDVIANTDINKSDIGLFYTEISTNSVSIFKMLSKLYTIVDKTKKELKTTDATNVTDTTNATNTNNQLLDYLQMFETLVGNIKIHLNYSEYEHKSETKYNLLLICETCIKKLSKMDLNATPLNFNNVDKKFNHEKFVDLVLHATDTHDINKLVNWLLQ